MNNKEKIKRDFIGGTVDIDNLIYYIKRMKDNLILTKDTTLITEMLELTIEEIKFLKVEFEERYTEIKNLKERIKELNKYNRFEIMDI